MTLRSSSCPADRSNEAKFEPTANKAMLSDHNDEARKDAMSKISHLRK